MFGSPHFPRWPKVTHCHSKISFCPFPQPCGSWMGVLIHCFPVSSVHSGKSNICRKPWRHPSFLLLNPSSDSPILLQHTQEFGNSSIIWHYMMDLYNHVWTVMLHLLKQNRKCYISGILLSHSNQNTDSLGVFAPSFFIEPWDEIISDILITVS